jgi:hypothetical protein
MAGPLKAQGVSRFIKGVGDFLIEIWRYSQDAFLAFTMVCLTAASRLRRG